MESRCQHKNGSLKALIKSSLKNSFVECSQWKYCSPTLLTEEFNTDFDSEPDLINKAVYMDPYDQSPWLYIRCLITNHSKKAFIREMYVSKALEAVVFISSEPVSKAFMEGYVVKVTHKDGVSSTRITGDHGNFNIKNRKNKKSRRNGLYKNHCKIAEECLSRSDQISESEVREYYKIPKNDKDRDRDEDKDQDKDQEAVEGSLEVNTQRTHVSLLLYSPALPGDISVVWLISLSEIDISKAFSVEARSVTDEAFLWQCNLSSSSQESLIRVETDIQRMLYDNVSHIVSISTLTKDLSVIRDLLHNEPANKWSLLAVVSILRLISPLESRPEILDILLKRLPTVDPLNIQLYSDAASKFILECHLTSLYHSHLRRVSLPFSDLTSISHLPWMSLMTDIDLSHNQLTVLPDMFRHYLLCLTKLNVSHNLLVSLLPLKGLRSLHDVDVSHNLITSFHDLQPVLHCIKLNCLNIKGNPVSQLDDLTDLVTDHPTSRLHIGSLSIVYDKRL